MAGGSQTSAEPNPSEPWTELGICREVVLAEAIAGPLHDVPLTPLTVEERTEAAKLLHAGEWEAAAQFVAGVKARHQEARASFVEDGQRWPPRKLWRRHEPSRQLSKRGSGCSGGQA